MARLLILGALTWPIVLGAAWGERASHDGDGHGLWSTIVYMAAGRVCHQQPERSFHSDGVQWPVCARCAGLYLAAPLGALAWRRRRRLAGPRAALQVFVLAAVPIGATLAWEWAGLGTPSNVVRFASALPMGATILWLLLAVTHRVD